MPASARVLAFQALHLKRPGPTVFLRSNAANLATFYDSIGHFSQTLKGPLWGFLILEQHHSSMLFVIDEEVILLLCY